MGVVELKFTCQLFGIISGAFIHSHAKLAPPNQCGTLAELAKKAEFKKSRQKGEWRGAKKDMAVGRRKKRGRWMDIVSSTGSGRARIFIVTSLNRSKVSLSLHNERLC